MSNISILPNIIFYSNLNKSVSTLVHTCFILSIFCMLFVFGNKYLGSSNTYRVSNMNNDSIVNIVGIRQYELNKSVSYTFYNPFTFGADKKYYSLIGTDSLFIKKNF